MLSPLVEAVVVEAGVVAAAGFSVVPEFVFVVVVVSVFEQAITTKPNTRHDIRIVVLTIEGSFVD